MKKALQIWLLLLILGVIGFGQSPASGTPSGMATGAPAGSQSLSEAERLNLYTGNFSYSLPLASVAGRGDIQIPLNLNIEQHWKNFGGYYFPNEITANQQVAFTRKVRYNPATLVYQYSHAGDRGCSGMFPNQVIRTTKKLYFTTPDGTAITLVDQQTKGQPYDHPYCYSSYSRGNIFIATDGSGTTFTSDTAAIDSSAARLANFDPGKYPATGYLNLGNGTRYRFEEGVVKSIVDRNGNKFVFSYIDDPNEYYPGEKKLIKITDSLNREVDIEYDVSDVAPYGLCDRIKFTGFNQSQQIIRISKADYRNILRSGYSPATQNELFGNGSGAIIPNLVVSAVWLPDGIRKYNFYYNPYLELARVELPTGTAVEYDYAPGVIGSVNNLLCGQNGVRIYRRFIERRIYISGTTSSGKTTFSRPEQQISSNSTCTYISNISTADHIAEEDFDGSGTRSGLKKHYFYNLTGGIANSFFREPVYYGSFYTPIPESWKDGREYRTDSFANDGVTLLNRTLMEWKNKVIPWISNQDFAPAYDTRSTNQISIALENGKALAILKKTEYDEDGSSDPDYFSHLNVKRAKGYNYKVLDLNTAQNADIDTIAGMFSESDLASVSETDYLYDPGYKDRHILGLASEIRIMNPVSPTQILARSQAAYDEQSQYYSMTDLGSTVGYEAPTGTYAHLRGNPTTYRTWFAEENRWIETHTQHDNFGNLRKQWDSSGDPNRFVETEFSAQYYYAYPTKTIAKAPDPTGTHGTDQNSIISTVYDFWSGRATSVTDANGQITSMEYDTRLRPKKLLPPAGGGITEKEYGDTPGNLFVKIKKQVDAQNWAETTSFLDNLGRVYKTQTTDSQGDIFSEVEYDNFGRVKRVSNPYRQGEQKYWSKPRYDNSGRVVETYAPAPDGQTGASIGTVEFGISTISGLVGNYVTATDASGRKARSFTNVYGQVVRVDEPTGNNDLGTLENPNQASYYTYNVKGELVKVQQGNQNQNCQTAQCRFFMYDSLGRLIRVKQPEQIPQSSLATTGNPENNQWTSGFTYDVFGNVLTVTDAKGMTITNTYDKAGRVTTSSYNDGVTPQVEYFYDGTGLGLPQPPQYSKGTLTKISNGVSETRYTSFDNYGKVLANQQITDGQTYNFEYKYDSFGNLTEETYPSGRVVKTHLDADGGLAAVSSKTANNAYKTYASNFSYTATGNVKAMMLGNGRWETAVFNERQQTMQIGLGNAATDTSLWKVNYDYGELNADGSVDAGKNIGMVAKQTITLPTTAFVQTYKYDALNRLKEAKETANTTSGTENWKQTFDYDRYGNRTNFYQKIGSNVLAINNVTKPQVDPATNRFTTGQGYVYDFNGNLVQDAENRQFTYDGDDKQTVVRDLTIPTSPRNPDANVTGRYYYDGEGNRVKKVTNLETTVFVYDAGGALVAEYSTQTNPEPTTSYLTTDNLGSPRVITDRQGNVTSRRDFMPFGEELLAGVGVRDTNIMKYSATGIDNIRQRFTGYEKDIETDLDFAEARMYKNRHGRFTAPDPLLSSASLSNPQTFNRYSYTGNNPVNYTDPSGLNWCRDSSGGPAIINTGKGIGCPGGPQFSLDGTTAEVTSVGAEFAANGARVGDIIRFENDGTLTVLDPNDAQQGAQIADHYGTTIRAGSDPVSMVDITSSISGTISSRPLDMLPLCPYGETCTPFTRSVQALDTSNNPPLQTVATIEKVVDLLTLVPALNVPATIIAITIDVGQGDFTEAGENAVGFIPFGKIFNKGGKFSKLFSSQAVDEVAHHMPQNAYLKKIGLSRSDGPSLGMTQADHALTESFKGGGKRTMRLDGAANRSTRERMFMDIQDIRRTFGRKYNKGMLSMIEYSKTLPQFQSKLKGASNTPRFTVFR